jgi:imidazole glycerol-phosphate synthase subunit HisH
MNRSLVGIVDYQSGNIRSVINAIETVGSHTQLIQSPDHLTGCSHIILPGVGSFGFCAERLRESGLLPSIEQWALNDGKPLLGICVGMQLMADYSEEQGRQDGLAWIGGSVQKLEKYDESDIRIPHVGWNEVVFKKSFGLFQSGDIFDFYFDHSYAYQNPAFGEELATCSHGRLFSAIIKRDNIIAVQFHPEKSQKAGMRFLESFLAL